MNKILSIPIVGIILFSLFAADLAWAKAHVPIDRVQICTRDGTVRNIKPRRLARELERGACRFLHLRRDRLRAAYRRQSNG